MIPFCLVPAVTARKECNSETRPSFAPEQSLGAYSKLVELADLVSSER